MGLDCWLHHVVLSVSDGSDKAIIYTWNISQITALRVLYFETEVPYSGLNYASSKWIESIYNYTVNVSVSSEARYWTRFPQGSNLQL